MASSILLAGPILRRVEPTSISIWLAFSKKQTVQAFVWEGAGPAGTTAGSASTTGAHAQSPISTSLEIGSGLHVAVVTIDTSQKKLNENKVYAYNVYFNAPGELKTKDLGTENLLHAPEGVEAKDFSPLGYTTGALPAFVIPSESLDKLHLAHGSCRKIHGTGDDAFSHLDDLIKKKIDKPGERVQQLYLTGDQIYADEVPRIVLPFINSLGQQLFNNTKEQLVLSTTAPENKVPCDMQHFPPAHRQYLVNTTAKLTGTGISSHLLGFQEYCATYLHYWSTNAWNSELVLMLDTFKKSNYDEDIGSFLYYFLVNLMRDFDAGKMTTWLFKPDKPEEKELENIPRLQKLLNDPAPAPTEQQKAVITKWTEKLSQVKDFEKIKNVMIQVDNFSDEETTIFSRLFFSKSSVVNESRACCDFWATLPKARRVLANVPTYMIFDDHEMTDDWNFSEFWNNRVYTSSLGTQVIRNGMMAYTIFQDWGNVPLEYPSEMLTGDVSEEKLAKYSTDFGKTKGNKAALLRNIAEYGVALSAGSKPEAPGEKSNAIDELLLRLPNKPAADQTRFATPVRWHYDIPIGRAHTFFLDTRTRREYEDFIIAPGLLSKEALDDQLPAKIAEMNYPVVFIISPVPALGLPVIEEFAQPLVGSLQGGLAEEGKGGAPVGAISGALHRDNEAWGFSEKHLEQFLERIALFKKVVILSGDVHYGYSAYADYWKERKLDKHARIIQLVCSSFKNGWDLDFVLLKSGFAQRLLTGFDYEFEKHGWKDKDVEVDGILAPRQRMRLHRNPVLLSKHGWHAGTTIKPAEPDWVWRLRIPADITEYTDLPKENPEPKKPVLPLAVTDDLGKEDAVASSTAAMTTFLQMATRHNSMLKLGLNRRIVWQPHFGHVFFTGTDNNHALNHEFYYSCRSDGFLNSDVAPDPNYAGLLSGPFTVHKINLDATDEEKKPPLKIEEVATVPE